MARVEPLDAAAWTRLRDLRLRALDDAPDAFGSSASRERAYDEQGWSRLLALGPWWVAVVDDEGAAHDVGIVSGGRREHDARRWVYSMWVDPRWRGQGVADELLAEVVAWARDEGAPSLGLDVTDRMPRARRFYERRGFIASGTVEPLPRDTSIQLIEMHLDLATAG